MNGYMWFMLLSVLSIPVLTGILVYRDAKARGMDAFLWSLAGALLPFFLGFIIYLVVSRQRTVYSCANCGKSVRQNFSVCPYCGAHLKKRCQNCDIILEPEWKVCAGCGTPNEPSETRIKNRTTKSTKMLWGLLLFCTLAPVFLMIFLVFHAYGIL